jgi:hypothetical protein
MIARAWLVLLWCSCSTETIEDGVCGNGILDRGEDCDAPDSRCRACSIRCDETADCEAYDASGGTAGFVCGPDRLCHAPSGEFELSTQLGVPSTTLRITDVDGDGRADLLIPSQTQIATVRFATSDEDRQQLAIQTPIARGIATFGPLDNRGGNDTLIPTSDGIVAYTTTDTGQPAPFPFPSFVPQEEGTPLFVQPITQEHLSIVGVAADGTSLSYTAFDVGNQPPTDLAETGMCGGLASDVFGAFEDMIDVFDVAPQHQMVAMWLQPPPPEVSRLCVLSVEFEDPVYAVTEIPVTAVPASRPVFARLRGGECPSLVVSQSGALVEYQPVSPTRPCRFQVVPSLLLGAPAGAVPVGAVPLNPEILGASTVALAMSTGIYKLTNSTLQELYTADRPMRRIKTADMDGDGDLDVVATSFNPLGIGSDDIDLLDRRPAGFLRFRFDTETEIQTFQLGDFDGNEFGDVAYVDFGPEGTRLQIAYGVTDQLLPGVTVGAFGQLLSMVPTQIFDSSDRIGAITDLAVLFIDDGGAQPQGPVRPPRQPVPALSLLHGSPQRTMLAFFDPRDQFPAPPPESQFRAVVTGKFTTDGQVNDVIAIEQNGENARAYRTRGASGGQLGIDVSSILPLVGGCGGSTTNEKFDPTVFCLDDAHFLAWREPGATHHVVVAVDSRYTVIAFDPDKMIQDMNIGFEPWRDTFLPAEGAVVRELQQVEIAGAQKLMIALGDPVPFSTTTGSLFLCDFDLATGPTSCLDISARLGELLPRGDGSSYACYDAGIAGMARAARFEPPTGEPRELVLLCTLTEQSDGATFPVGGGLFRASLDLSRAEVLLDGVIAQSLEIGDVSGDGIEDLVLQDNPFSVSIFRQCTSRDTACKTFGGEPEMGGK